MPAGHLGSAEYEFEGYRITLVFDPTFKVTAVISITGGLGYIVPTLNVIDRDILWTESDEYDNGN